MAIIRDLANVFDLDLLRPIRTGAGLDPVGVPTTLADDLTAIYEPTEAVIRDVDGREIRITGRFWIDPFDNGGADIDVKANDWLTFTDWKGDAKKEQLIVRVSPWFCGTELDHLLLEIGGG